MNGIILYSSTYGTTERYAMWLAEQTGFPAVRLRDVKKEQLRSAESVIVGCPVHAGRPSSARWIRKQWPLLQDKLVILFTTSGAPPSLPASNKGYVASLPEHIRARIEHFPLGGKMSMSVLKPRHRLLMRIAQKIEKNPDAKATMLLDIDNVDRAGISPILARIRSFDGASDERS